ncbi:MAG: DUF393 domain-containing protein [Chloroflexi bacterium HGW-Chloroflexi-10]|nr:MAG: DUF393 domain-containing protein [Chloroflexi bacterium HGW-Chloroflexi-10]
MAYNGGMHVTLFYDGSCPFCTASAAALERMDWLRRLECVNLLTPGVLEAAGIGFEAAMTRIQVRSADGRVTEGIDGVLAIARQVPLLWLGVPLIWLVIRLGWGQRLYDWIAARRLLIPLPGVCPVQKAKY